MESRRRKPCNSGASFCYIYWPRSWLSSTADTPPWTDTPCHWWVREFVHEVCWFVMTWYYILVKTLAIRGTAEENMVKYRNSLKGSHDMMSKLVEGSSVRHFFEVSVITKEFSGCSPTSPLRTPSSSHMCLKTFQQLNFPCSALVRKSLRENLWARRWTFEQKRRIHGRPSSVHHKRSIRFIGPCAYEVLKFTLWLCSVYMA